MVFGLFKDGDELFEEAKEQINQKDYDKALRTLQKSIEKDPDNALEANLMITFIHLGRSMSNPSYYSAMAQRLREKGTIEIAPLAYMRGRTLNHARVIIDESQNASLSTLKMALTRLGEGSKMVLTGDITQIDLPKKETSGLERCAKIVDGIDGISVVRLGNRDVVRNRIVRDIVKAFERAESARRK